MLIAIYILTANRFSFRILPAGTITLACITALIATHNAASTQQRYLLAVTLALLNAVGIIVIERNNRFKRVEYGAHTRDRDARRIFEALAASDPLTGILNRRSFVELARHSLDRFKRYRTGFCLAIFDLDHFKQMNDSHGHLAGDEAIKRFANLVSSKKRPGDIFGRLGGDEFGFILPQATLGDAVKVVSRIQNALRGVRISSPKGYFRITFSAGITAVRVQDKSPNDVVHRADKALYQAKGKGGNRIEQS